MFVKLMMTWWHIILLSWLILEANSVQIHTCQRRCGNVSIEYPFGMMSKECYFNKGFEIHTCQRRCKNVSIEYPFGMMSKECYFNKGFEMSALTKREAWLFVFEIDSRSYLYIYAKRRCGDVSIRYPFGMMSKECYFNKGFEVSCRNSSGPEKAFLASVNLELSYIEKDGYNVGVNLPVFSSNCGNNRSHAQGVDLSGSPFTFEHFYNRFTAVGCNNYAEIRGRKFEAIGGCLSTCRSEPNSSSLSAGRYCLNCCQTTIPPGLKFFNASVSNYRPSFRQTNNNNSEPDQECRSAFIIANDSFSFRYRDVEQVPAMLEWGREIGSCFETKKHWNESWVTLSERHLCLCNGGIRVNELICEGTLICLNTPSEDECPCPDGYYNSGLCNNYYTFHKKSKVKTIVIASCSAALGILFLFIGAWRLCKFLNTKKEIKLKQKFFKRNGGLLLQQKLFSNEGNLENTNLFTSKELEKATDNYNANRILGQGGQGTVFKGMLTDGRIVAIKKSKIMFESNVTDVPLLVYEFIPHGTLYQYIHDQTEEFPIPWEMRLRIATEVANALSYMHSAASIPIYHRDIKSTNILLDDKYRAKVSDFGTSRSIAIDQTHLTTQVKGTFGYFDPEYFRSSQFTDKSDVYSFGVVLVELLTGQKPIHSSTNSNEVISLASHFVHAMKEERLFEALDARVLKEGRKEEITTFANIAKRCLQSNGKKRPTMREVASELESIKTSNGNAILHPFPGNEEVEYFDGDITEHFETSTSSFTGRNDTSLVDIELPVSKMDEKE
ncbi:hypothetical protein JRO89_XS14G0178800 [Xanthoceras sorbifolium]|uniref:Protein kinase domain-containing protein n=1 Tax=Xanthoceras sorbifolium TaxID=99658 RepID=A0ABQ8H5R6_9ROSI|nr:hypothetical protein JRO89_XS14G0178800 [Xanthoceras sorbifolium]